MYMGIWASRGEPGKIHMDFASTAGRFVSSLWLCFGDFNKILHLHEKKMEEMIEMPIG